MHGRLPGYRCLQAYDRDRVARPTSWAFAILPFLEDTPVYNEHGRKGGTQWRGTRPNLALETFVCPSDRTQLERGEVGNVAVTSYVANAGMADALTAEQPGDWRENGLLLDYFTHQADSSSIRSPTKRSGISFFCIHGFASLPMLQHVR